MIEVSIRYYGNTEGGCLTRVGSMRWGQRGLQKKETFKFEGCVCIGEDGRQGREGTH